MGTNVEQKPKDPSKQERVDDAVQGYHPSVLILTRVVTLDFPLGPAFTAHRQARAEIRGRVMTFANYCYD